MTPDFICIGASRSGTTWLYRMLQKHNQVWVPPIKELHYFDSLEKVSKSTIRNVHLSGYRLRRLGWQRAKHYVFYPAGIINRSLNNRIYTDFNWDFRFFFGDGSLKWYQSLFEKADQNGLVTGEITPNYALLSEGMIKKIYQMNKELKIIFLMRDPIDKSWSSFCKYIRDSNRKSNSINDLEIFKEIFKEKILYEKSSYVNIIDKWSNVFDYTNIGFYFFDDIREDPKKLLDEISCFLGIEPWSQNELAEFRVPINVSTSLVDAIPEDIEYFLSVQFEEQLFELRKRFENPVSKWHDKAIGIISKNK